MSRMQLRKKFSHLNRLKTLCVCLLFARSGADAKKLFQQAAPHFHSFISHFCTFCISILPPCFVVGRGVKTPPHLWSHNFEPLNCKSSNYKDSTSQNNPGSICTPMIELLTQIEEKSATIDNCIRSNVVFEPVLDYFYRIYKVLKKPTYMCI